MQEYNLNNNESIFYEGMVKVGNSYKNIKIVLTSEKILFLKEKGIFVKKPRVINIIPLENIKIYKDSVQVTSHKEKVIIETINDKITLTCANKGEAKKLAIEIIDAKTNTNLLERSSVKLKKIIRNTKSVALGLLGTVLAVKETYDWFKKNL